MAKPADTQALAEPVTASGILVVKLDGTLVLSNTLLETFWSSFSARWQTPFVAAMALLQGRAKLKDTLDRNRNIDVSLLPYNHLVLTYISQWRSLGGKAVLLSTGDQQITDQVSQHLGLFDHAYGLDGAPAADFLVETLGGEPFTYMGSTAADIPIWQRAAKTITVDSSSALRKRIDVLNSAGAIGGEHIVSTSAGITPYIKALRPHQWLKNTLVFLPMLMAQNFTREPLQQSLLAFVAFCFVSSCVYLLNDLLDLEADRAHPRKRARPFASGSVSLAHGTLIAPLLFLLGMVPASILGPSFVLIMVGYFVATSAYSLVLKRQPIIDICTLAGLYTLRIWAGGTATVTPLSVWLLAFSIFFFLALAAIKRQAELVDSIAAGRLGATGRGYHVGDLPLIVGMATAAGYVSVLVLALYLNSPDVLIHFKSPKMLLGICLILLYWVSRVIMVTHRGAMHDDPIIFAVKDRVSQLCLLLIIGFALAGKTY